MSLELANAPGDSISRVQFAPGDDNENLLLVSSWDNTVRLHDIELNTVRAVHTHTHPVLDCCFLRDATACISGGLARDLRQYDFQHEQDFLIGKHTDAVRSVGFAPEVGLVLSGSWDKTMAAWDARTKNICHRLELEGKAFCMCVTPQSGPFSKIVVGDSAKQIRIFDMRKLEKPEQIRENVLKYQLRCMEAMTDGLGFAVGSTEGRVAWEYFQPGTNALRPSSWEFDVNTIGSSYAFRCHREKIKDEAALSECPPGTKPGMDRIFPVNALAFHPRFAKSFATGGGDGTVSVWDGGDKRRLWRLSKPFLTAVTSVAFSSNGNKLAIGISNDFSRGVQDARMLQFARVVVRNVADEDVKPKSVSAPPIVSG